MAEKPIGRPEVFRIRDFIGRDVTDPRGDKLGTVSDLLLDRRRGDVRFVDVNLGLFRKRVLIPVGELDWGEDAFIVRRWTSDQLKALPAFDPDIPLTARTLEEMELAYPRLYGDPDRLPPPGVAGEARIVPLKAAKDFKLSKGDPDVRGWNVFGADGERVGVVSEMLVDPGELKIRYLDVDILEDLFTLKEDRHVLIPLEEVELRERGNDIWIKHVPAEAVARLPAYSGGPVDPGMEEIVHANFRPPR